jgi:hypothetical protein
MANLGKVMTVIKGAYNGSTQYERLDVVTYNSSSWVAKQTTTGHTPPTDGSESNTYWQLMAKGYTGSSFNDLTDKPTTVSGYGITNAYTKTEVDNITGDLSDLETESNADLVSGINEVNGKWYEGINYKLNNPYSHGGSLHLKGQLHCHSTNSDGLDTPTAVVTAYKNLGYGFITITDHNYVTPNPGVSGITWIGDSVEETLYRHIVAYNVQNHYSSPNVQDVITYHRNKSEMTSIAHPMWDWASYFIDKNEINQYYDYNFIEVYNGITLGENETTWDASLSLGNKTFATATDDYHRVDYGINLGWVVVYTDVNSKDAILQSLRNGNFYASTGNDVVLTLSGNIITASSTNSSLIEFIGRDGRVLYSSTGTSANYTIKGDELYVRVRSTKVSDSTKAWSQPIFIDSIGGNTKPLTDIYRNLYAESYQERLLNGNFEVWQRGTSITNPTHLDALQNCIADKWGVVAVPSGFTFPTSIIHSRQNCIGEISNASYCYRVTTNGAGSGSLDAGTQYAVYNRIENGTRFLCGENKKLTLSFWARTSITGKRIGVSISQRYGTGGSPSANETIKGNYWALTDKWKKYTLSIDTNTLISKVFGSNHDDYLGFRFEYAWDASYGATIFPGTPTAEGFVGSGYIDIAQVQVVPGDTDLPFISVSFGKELDLCQRYYEKSYSYNDAPHTSTANGALFSMVTASTVMQGFRFKKQKRIPPTTLAIISPSGTDGKIWGSSDTDVSSGVAASNIGDSGVRYLGASGGGLTVGTGVTYHYLAIADI